MKVFLSWSGPTSKALARALRDWLPMVIQAVKPWMSERDIGPGERWGTEVAGELAEAKFGIICLTPDNLTEPWILFEAGALSKTLETTYVCPYLFRVPVAALQYPLAQFQAVLADEAGSLSIIRGINGASGDRRLSEEALKGAFDVWWPKLRAKLDAIPQQTQGASPARPEREILEEILQLIRGMVRTAEEQRQRRFMESMMGRARGASGFGTVGVPFSSLRGVGGLKQTFDLPDVEPPEVEVKSPEPEPAGPEEPEPEPPERKS
ncbi:MAG: toll/interleukin-1 receptor domain-containing protein [Terriglobia bacterium]